MADTTGIEIKEREESADWRENKYSEVFEGTLRVLAARRELEPGFGVGDAQGILDHLYISEGNDWIGRGELGDIVMSATVAAYECFISDWKRER
jgi:hypothetical protein